MNQRGFSCSLAVSLFISAAPALGHGVELAPNVPKIGAAFPMMAVPAAGSVAAPSLNQLPVLNAAALPASGVGSISPAVQSPRLAAGSVIAPAAVASEQIHQALVQGGLHTADALFKGLYDFGQFDRYQVPMDPAVASDAFGGGRGGSGAQPPRKRTGGGGGSGHSGPRIEFADSVSPDHREHLTSALHTHIDQLAEALAKLKIPSDQVNHVLLRVESAQYQPAQPQADGATPDLSTVHYSITVVVPKAHGKLTANLRDVLKAVVVLPEGKLTLTLAPSEDQLRTLLSHYRSPYRQIVLPTSSADLSAEQKLSPDLKAGEVPIEFADSVADYDREWLTSALRAHLDQLAEALAPLGIPLNQINHVSLRVDSAQYGTARAKVDGIMRSLPSVHYSISVRNAPGNPEAALGVLKAVVVLPEGKLTLTPALSEDQRMGVDERLDFLTPPQRYILKYRGTPLAPEELQQLRAALKKIGARIVQDDDNLSSPMLLVEGDATLIQSVLSSRQGWTSSEENFVPLPSLHPGLPPLASPVDPAAEKKMGPDLKRRLAELEADQGVDVIIRIHDYIDWPGEYERQAAPILQYAQVHHIQLTATVSAVEIQVHATAEQLYHLAAMDVVEYLKSVPEKLARG